jgi:hypothetical protein
LADLPIDQFPRLPAFLLNQSFGFCHPGLNPRELNPQFLESFLHLRSQLIQALHFERLNQWPFFIRRQRVRKLLPMVVDHRPSKFN